MVFFTNKFLLVCVQNTVKVIELSLPFSMISFPDSEVLPVQCCASLPH